MQKERNSNLELLRIFLIIAIICHHYIVNSGIINVIYNDIFSYRSCFAMVIGGWGKISINVFILITGYFMCNKSISIRKFLKLLLEIEFYNIIIYTIFVLSGYTGFSKIDFVNAIIPIKMVTTDFSQCFVLFYLFIPFINTLIRSLNKKRYILLLSMLLFIYSILGLIDTHLSMNYVSWFFVVYLIGAYIKLYGKKEFESVKIWVFMMIITCSLSIISIFVCAFISTRYDIKSLYYFISDCNKPLAILTSISIFMLFKNIKIKQSRFINTIASTVFGILLIHANSSIMRNFLWYDLFKNSDYYFKSTFYLHLICCVFVVFTICSIADYIRIRIIERPFFKYLDNRMQKYKWYNEIL